MKKIAFFLALVSLAVTLTPACSKSSGGNNEATLVVETTPADGSNNLNLLGPDFPLKIEIKSAMPASGVKIDISAKVEGSSNPPFFTSSNNSTTAVNNYTITGTPANVTCVVSITVTSLSKSTNTWTGGYRYSKK